MEKRSQARQVKCPQCGHLALFSAENPFRPFCSERCRLIDLGQWAEGTYRIPAEDSTALDESDSRHGHEETEDSH
ncbi:MAG: DNA gyrase inhibitor YacG [Bdellovibrionaceae bacterium]|nr:DNA gyrase inhibitor YacG [Pseudobdellovibrionaceae bacterium]MBX3033071.1 DNA gyrase inhibitor YacG [Pseudobdellovibrionaceae bacterium]